MKITPGESKRLLVWGKFSPTSRGTIQFIRPGGANNFVSDGVRVTNTFAEFYIPGNLLEAADLPVSVRLIVNGTVYRTYLFEAATGVSEPPVTSPGEGGGTVFDTTELFTGSTPNMKLLLDSLPSFVITNGQTPEVSNGLTGEPGANLFDVDGKKFTFTGRTGLYSLSRSINSPGGAQSFSSTFEANPLVGVSPVNVNAGGSLQFSRVNDVMTLVNGETYEALVLADVADGAFSMNYTFMPLVLS